MEKMELIAPCHFGMEAVLKREVLDLGYEISTVEDGRVCFWGDAQAICDANVFLRTAERVLLKVGSFKAETFDELFEKTRVLPWENYIPKNGKFWVTKAASVKSKLFSPSDIQSIMKKAMAECDTLDKERLIHAAVSGMDQIMSYLAETKYGDGALALAESASAFERWCDNQIMETIRPQLYNSFSLGPLVAYVLARENEIKTVRIILTGKRSGLPEEFIRERAREMNE